MIAEMQQDGYLVITAETNTERYALDRFLAGYQQGIGGIVIDTIDDLEGQSVAITKDSIIDGEAIEHDSR